jgi:endoglucanase
MGRRATGLLAGTLWLLSTRGKAVDTDIRLNTVGAIPGRAKLASVLGAGEASAWTLRDAGSSQVVASGSLSPPRQDADTGQSLKTADFSAWDKPGRYVLEVPSVGSSAPFRIAADAFNDAYVLAMKGFYGWRCGTAVSFEEGGRRYSHAACHLEDGYLDHLGKPGVLKDAGRGWHDAGDYNKYTVNAGISVGCLLQAWERFSAALGSIPLAHIPEHGGAIPDFLAELKWELDWVLTMQYSPQDGRVSHKLSSEHFGPFVMPEQDQARRFFCPYGSAATADFVAMLAKASRAYRPFDQAYAQRCLDAAQVSWDYLKAHPEDVRADQKGFSTGGYGCKDAPHRLWAAAEMWESTGDRSVLGDLEARIRAQGAACDVDWDWSNPENLGFYAYVMSKREGRDQALLETLKRSIRAAADALVGARDQDGYGRCLGGSYYWGCNGGVARSSLTLDIANALFPKAAYLDTAMDQLGYLYGRNVYARSQVTGEGLNPPLHPHHRPSGSGEGPHPWPGLLVGGGWPRADSWNDVQSDFRTNEVAINWNSALVYNLALFAAPR